MPLTWQVTGDVPDQVTFDGAGNPVTGHRISFLTGDGNRGSVFVDDDHYTPDAVRAVIHAQAERVDSINNLSHGL